MLSVVLHGWKCLGDAKPKIIKCRKKINRHFCRCDMHGGLLAAMTDNAGATVVQFVRKKRYWLPIWVRKKRKGVVK